MNREIKFRVWCVDEETLDYDIVAGNILSAIHGSGDPLSDKEAKSFILQQYTGLKDENGKDIYEGDILKHDIGLGPVYWEVVWDADAAAWKTTKEHGGNSGDWFDYYEVAGNIFENPELLKA